MTDSILDRIVRHKKQEIETLPSHDDVPLCTQNFSHLFNPRPGLIAEIKAASPSEGDIVTSFDPAGIAAAYQAGGAGAISVLTDAGFFKGSFEILKSVRAVTNLPLLCKDFILSEKQIRHARAHGADLCLLIVKILTTQDLRTLKETIEALGMQAVIEVQTDAELDIALAVDPGLLLINNRNLESFAVDLTTTERMLARIPPAVRVIAASGIKAPEDLAHFPARVDGFLIGTALMRADDKIDFLRRCRAVKN